MTKIIRTGDVTVQRIVEQETSFLPALEMIPALTPELLAENHPLDGADRSRFQGLARPVLPVLCPAHA
jgi:hypothetical protein